MTAKSCPYCHAPDTGKKKCGQCGNLLKGRLINAFQVVGRDKGSQRLWWPASNEGFYVADRYACKKWDLERNQIMY